MDGYFIFLNFVVVDSQDQAMASQFADDTAAMYERGISLLKNNIMLYFAYADYEEGRCKYAKVHSIYKKLISLESVDPTLVSLSLFLSFFLCLYISVIYNYIPLSVTNLAIYSVYAFCSSLRGHFVRTSGLQVGTR